MFNLVRIFPKRFQPGSKNSPESPQPPSTFKFSINKGFKNKDRLPGGSWAKGWTTVEASPSGLKELIESGYCFNPAHLAKGYRQDENFISSQLLVFDIDNKTVIDGADVYQPNLTIEQALAHPIIRQYAVYLYPTPSHTHDWHRFRIVFILPEAVTDPAVYKTLIASIGSQHIPGYDPATTSVTNLFYGHEGCEPILWNPNAVAPADWIQAAKQTAQPTRLEIRPMAPKPAAKKAKAAPSNGFGPNLDIAREWFWAIDPNRFDGADRWDCYRATLMAAHESGINREEAYRWSAQSQIHQDKEFERIWSYITGKGSAKGKNTRGTLHYWAKQHGWSPQKPSPKPKTSGPALAQKLGPKFQEWADTWEYTYTHAINQEKLDFPAIWAQIEQAVSGAIVGEPLLLVIRSGLGTGKTQFIKMLLLELAAHSVLALFHRNALSTQSCARWSTDQDSQAPSPESQWMIFKHLQDLRQVELMAALAQDFWSRIACCLDSLHHFGDQSRDIIILDEFVSLVHHLALGDTLDEKNAGYYQHFKQVIRQAKLMVLTDGMASDFYVNVYRTALAEAGVTPKVITIDNRHQGKTVEFKLFKAFEGKDEKPSIAKSLFEDAIEDAVARVQDLDEFIAIPSDAKEFCKDIYERLTRKGYRGIAIHGDNSGTQAVKAMLKDLDSHIRGLKVDGLPLPIDFIVFSPSCSTGLNWESEFVSPQGFLYLCGNSVDIRSAHQQARRFRRVDKWVTFIGATPSDEGSGWRQSSDQKLKQLTLEYVIRELRWAFEDASIHPDEMIQKIMRELALLQQGRTEIQTSQFWDLTAKLAALENFEHQHFEACFTWAAQRMGHTVSEAHIDLTQTLKSQASATSTAKKELKQELKVAKRVDQSDRIKEKVNAFTPEINVQLTLEAEMKDCRENGPLLDEAQRNHYASLKILAVCPILIERPELRTPDAIAPLVDNDDFKRGLRKYWWLTHMDATRVKTQKYWLERLRDSFKLGAGELSSDGLYLATLIDLGLLDLVKGDEALYTQTSSEIKRIYRRVCKSEDIQYGLQGKKPGKANPIQFINRLLSGVGVVIRSERIGTDCRERVYRYYAPDDPLLSPDNPNPLLAKSILETLTIKHASLLSTAEQQAQIRDEQKSTQSYRALAELEETALKPTNFVNKSADDEGLKPCNLVDDSAVAEGLKPSKLVGEKNEGENRPQSLAETGIDPRPPCPYIYSTEGGVDVISEELSEDPEMARSSSSDFSAESTQALSPWFEPESLADVRTMLEQAVDPEAMAELAQFIPPQVLELLGSGSLTLFPKGPLVASEVSQACSEGVP